MNARYKTLLLSVGFAAVLGIGELLIAIEKETVQKQPKRMLTLPEDTLPLRENQLVARKVKAGWQLCRVKRFVWQDALVILQSEGKVFGLIRETDTLDSKSPSENNGLFVVLGVSPQKFASLKK